MTLSVNYASPQPPGTYKVLWSQTQLFDGAQTRVIKEGVISNGATSVAAQITVPESVYGIHFIRFKPDNGANFINFQFSVLPAVQVKPSSVASGAVVSISGNGFPANDIVLFKFDSQFLELNVSTNETGSFLGQLVTSKLSAGKHNLMAMTQLATQSSSTTLEILPVVVKSEDTHQTPQSTATQTPKTQDTKPTVPTDSTSGKNTVSEPKRDKIAPPIPTPISPAGDQFGIIDSQLISFQWAQVKDESGVTYTIEISESHDFSSGQSIRKSGLTDTSYTAIMEPGTYYWRVKAIDREGNESHWAYAPRAFKVGELSALVNEFVEIVNNNSDIAIIVLCGLGAFIILSTVMSSIHSLRRPPRK